MATTDLDLRTKLAQQDAALQAMAQHLEKFKDFELESSVKVTEELAQAMEVQNQLRLRNESLLRSVENQAHTIELLLVKRMQLMGQVEEAQNFSKRFQAEYEEQLHSDEAAYRVLENQLHESKSELYAAHITINSLQAQLESERQQLSHVNSAIEERASSCEKQCSILNVQLKDMESLNQRLSTELEQNQDFLVESEEQVIYLKSELSAVNSELEKLKIEYNMACTNLSSLQSRCQQYANENDQLLAKLQSAAANINHHRNKYLNLESDNAKFQQDCASYREIIAALKRECSVSNEKYAALSAEISDLEKRNNSLSSQNEDLAIKLKEKEQALENAEKLKDSNLNHLLEIQHQSKLLQSYEKTVQEAESAFLAVEETYKKDLQSQSELIQNYTEKLKQTEDLLVASEEQCRIAKRDSSELEQTYLRRMNDAENALKLSESKFSEEIASSRSSYVHDLNMLQDRIESLQKCHQEENEKLQQQCESQFNQSLRKIEERHIKEIRHQANIAQSYAEKLHELEQILKATEDGYGTTKQELCELQQIFNKRALDAENALALAESKYSEEIQSIRSSHEAELQKARCELKSLKDTSLKQIENIKDHYESKNDDIQSTLRERNMELELQNEYLQSEVSKLEKTISKHVDNKQSEKQIVSELETSLLECEQLYIVNNALKAAKNQALEDVRRYQTRIKELSSELESKKDLEFSASALKSKLETTAAKFQTLYAAFSSLPKAMEMSLQEFEAQISKKITFFSFRLHRNSEQISIVQKAFNIIRSQHEHDRREFKRIRKGEQAGFQRIMDCSQASIEELLCKRVQLEQRITEISQELGDVNLKFDHSNQLSAQELSAQNSLKSLFESLQFQTMHIIASLQHEADDLMQLTRLHVNQINNLESQIQHHYINRVESCILQQDNCLYANNMILHRHINIQNPKFNPPLFADAIKWLNAARCLNDLYRDDLPIGFCKIFEEISRIVANETLELKTSHAQGVDSLLKQLEDRTSSCDFIDQTKLSCVDDCFDLVHSFRGVLNTIEADAYPPGRFSPELQQLSHLFDQLASLRSSNKDVTSLCKSKGSLHDLTHFDDRRCEKCGKTSYLPIYCHCCASKKQQLDDEQTKSLHHWNRAGHELQDEISQLRSCLNKAASAITELEIRLQEANTEKSRILEDFERVKNEKQAYVGLLQESVNEIYHMEETERDLRNAHRSVDEELHRSKVLLIGEGRAKQIFSRRLRMLQDTLHLTRAELQQYKLDVVKLDALNKQHLSDLEKTQQALSAQSVQNSSPKKLENQIVILENDRSSLQMQLSQSQEQMGFYQAELKCVQSQNEMFKKTLTDLNVTIRRGLRAVVLVIPQVKTFMKEYIQGERRTLCNQFHSLLKLINLDRISSLDLKNRLKDLQEKDLLQSQALTRAGRQLKEFQIVLSAQTTQIQLLKQQRRQCETSAVTISKEHSPRNDITFRRLPSERDIP